MRSQTTIRVKSKVTKTNHVKSNGKEKFRHGRTAYSANAGEIKPKRQVEADSYREKQKASCKCAPGYKK